MQWLLSDKTTHFSPNPGLTQLISYGGELVANIAVYSNVITTSDIAGNDATMRSRESSVQFGVEYEVTC